MEALLTVISGWIIGLISHLGYWGIILGMAIESACIPLPSEVIMPFSGYLVSRGEFGLLETGLAGALGNLLGSWAAYAVGYFGGRPFLERYGRYLLITHQELAWADRWFSRYGEATAFFSRLLPVIRTFVSLPAGVARMPILRFSIYTFLGSFPFSLALAYVGYLLGENWDHLGPYFHRFSMTIGLFMLAGLGYLIWHRWSRSGRRPRNDAAG
jgi:membrane protein DedA with SNARE-associated domain